MVRHCEMAMRKIRNPVIWLERRGELVNQRAKAIKHHRERRHLDAELREVTTALIHWQNRQDERKAS